MFFARPLLVIGIIAGLSNLQAAPLRHEEAVLGKNNEQIITDMRVNDHLITVSIDTGSSVNLSLFPAAVEKAGLKLVEAPRYDATPGDGYPGKTSPATLQIGGRTIPNQVIDVFQGAPNGHDGLLGWPGLETNIWGFLFAEKKLVTLEEMPTDVLSWVQFDVIPLSPNVLCLAPKNRTATDFRIMVDTGTAGGVILSPKEWKRWKAENPNQPLTLECVSTGGALKHFLLEVGWAEKFQLGEFTLSQVAVHEAPPEFYREDREQRTMAWGVGALKRMELVVDPGKKVAYANAITTAPAPFAHNRIGAIFLADGIKPDEVWARVVQGGPAFKAGMQTGDRIIAIDGQAIDAIDHPEFIGTSNEQAPAGTKFKVTAQRAGRLLNFEIVAEDILGPHRREKTGRIP